MVTDLIKVYYVFLQENHLPSPVSLRSASVSSDLDATVQSIIDKMETGLEVRVFNPKYWEFAKLTNLRLFWYN